MDLSMFDKLFRLILIHYQSFNGPDTNAFAIGVMAEANNLNVKVVRDNNYIERYWIERDGKVILMFDCLIYIMSNHDIKQSVTIY